MYSDELLAHDNLRYKVFGRMSESDAADSWFDGIDRRRYGFLWNPSFELLLCWGEVDGDDFQPAAIYKASYGDLDIYFDMRAGADAGLVAQILAGNDYAGSHAEGNWAREAEMRTESCGYGMAGIRRALCEHGGWLFCDDASRGGMPLDKAMRCSMIASHF